MKRVLIVTYYWPPAGGPGVQRWLKFVKYLRDFDIEPLVYIPENPHYPISDPKLQSEIPGDITILRHPIREPYGLAKLFSKGKTNTISSGIISEKKLSSIEKLMLFIRGNFFIPDARVGWVKPSAAFLKTYLQENNIDTIITTGPPHSLHLIGLKLKKELDINWVADFRDPWTSIHYHASLRLTKKSKNKHKKLEAEVLQTADRVIVTSEGTKQEFQQLSTTPVTVITNGFDEYLEENIESDSEFSISHIGSLLNDRNPEVLWKVLEKLKTEDKEFANDLRLRIAGVVSEEVMESIKAHKLFENLEFLGYVSHTEARKLQRAAKLLLIVEMDRRETRAIIPGKLFEYLSARRPIIALGPKGSDMKAIIEDTSSGVFFEYSEKEMLKNQLKSYYSDYRNDRLKVDSQNIEQYSRRELSRKLAGLLKQL